MADPRAPGSMSQATLGAALRRNGEEIVAGLAFVVVVFAVCWAVITRYITAHPATWAGEISAAAFAWVVFFGAAAGFKRHAHVSIDLLVNALPAAPRRMIAYLVDALMIAFCAYVTLLAIDFTIESWTTPMPSLRIPYSWHYASAALGFALMTLRYIQAALPRWRGREG